MAKGHGPGRSQSGLCFEEDTGGGGGVGGTLTSHFTLLGLCRMTMTTKAMVMLASRGCYPSLALCLAHLLLLLLLLLMLTC